MQLQTHELEAAFRQRVLDMAVESWRFARIFSRLLEKLELTEAQRYSNQLRYFLKRLDENLVAADMRLVNLEGLPFDPGMAADALNIADFAPEDVLVVDQMIEPVVMGSEGIIKPGTVMLKKRIEQ